MQVTVKSTKVLKTGEGDWGEWKLVKVVTESGDYTTFASGAEELSPGTVLDITDLNEDKGGKSFKKYTVISEGQGSSMSKDEWAEKDRIKNSSIEIQNAYTGVPALVELLKKYPDDLLANAAYNYAMSKLGNWPSQGVPDAPESATSPTEVEEVMIQPDQVERIKKAAEKYKDNTDAYVKVMKDAFDLTNYKKLNQLQAESFIKLLTAGEGLETEPENLPFKQ
jgi:hypothetical protein